ncbi:MAG: hypothetical protein WCY23_02450 [Candidatus Omnitrophota bacterium]
MDRFILKAQKEWVFNKIVELGLKPSEFEWGKTKSGYISDTEVLYLKYINTAYYYKFDFYDVEYYYCYYSPGAEKPLEKVFTKKWIDIASSVIDWLISLEKEISIIDPWEEISSYKPGDKVDLGDEITNSPFSSPQIERIIKAIEKLKSEIERNYNLDKEQKEIVNSKLDYLIDKAKTIGRIDWRNIFAGTIVNLAVDLALDSQKYKLLWQLVKSCFEGIRLLTIK